MFSLSYKKIENVDDKEYNFLASDEFTLQREDVLVVYYKRKLYFEPEGVFALELTYKLVFEPVKGMDWQSLSDQEILDALYGNALDQISEVSARMSLVIGEVLFNGNHEPLILPPQVIYNPEEESEKQG